MTAIGTSRYEKTEPAEGSVRFTLLAYDTVDNAKVGMKELVASEHGDGGADLTSLSIEVEADETDAFTVREHTTAILRVGTVVAYLPGLDIGKSDLQALAELQIERIKTAAAGRNPDA